MNEMISEIIKQINEIDEIVDKRKNKRNVFYFLAKKLHSEIIFTFEMLVTTVMTATIIAMPLAMALIFSVSTFIFSIISISIPAFFLLMVKKISNEKTYSSKDIGKNNRQTKSLESIKNILVREKIDNTSDKINKIIENIDFLPISWWDKIDEEIKKYNEYQLSQKTINNLLDNNKKKPMNKEDLEIKITTKQPVVNKN